MMPINPYQSPRSDESNETAPRRRFSEQIKRIHFGWVFAGAVAFSFCVEVLFDIGMIFVLGGMAPLYLFGLMLIGVFSRPFKPYADDLPSDMEARAEPETKGPN